MPNQGVSSRGSPETPRDSQDTSPYSITEEELQERMNKPTYGNISRQLFIGGLACLSTLSFGTCLGWSHSASRAYLEVENQTSDIGQLVSMMFLGCSFGVVSSSFLIRQLGPKKCIKFVGLFYILNWWLTLVPSIGVQMVGRFFLGFLGMSYSSAGETLLFHTVHYGIRKYITVFQNCTMVMGVLVGRVIGTATSQFWLTVICGTIPIFHYVVIFWVPESPVFLYPVSTQAAAKSLAWYRGEGNFYMDMAYLKKDWDASRLDSENYGYMLFSRVVYRPLLVVLAVTFFQIVSGYYVFMFYSIEVLSDGKVAFSPLIDSACIGVCFICTKLLWGTLHAFHHEWKVRGLLITSCFFTAVSLALFAVYLLLDEYHINIEINLRQVPLLVVCCFLFFFDMGLECYPKILLFEYMPFQIYKSADLMMRVTHWMFGFFLLFFFGGAFVTFPTCSIFAFFSLFMFVATLFCYFFVVEPRGKSLIQVQLAFGGNPTGRRGAIYNLMRQTI